MTVDVWVRRACTLLVAGVAAYASYQHQRGYAREGGSDSVGAVLWPLSVDGLLVLATVGVLSSSQQVGRRYRIAVWVSFLAGIGMSLTANFSAAPELALQPVLVAGWPPVALLLAVELLGHSPRSRQHTETAQVTPVTEQAAVETEEAGSEIATATPMVVRGSESDTETGDESDDETAQVITLAGVSPGDEAAGELTAQEVMWAHFRSEQAHGRTPTGAQPDRVTGTNNYGRTLFAAVAQRRPHPTRRSGSARARRCGMTAQLPAVPPGPADIIHTRWALARLVLSSAYREAADFAAGGVPTVSDEYGEATTTSITPSV